MKTEKDLDARLKEMLENTKDAERRIRFLMDFHPSNGVRIRTYEAGLSLEFLEIIGTCIEMTSLPDNKLPVYFRQDMEEQVVVIVKNASKKFYSIGTHLDVVKCLGFVTLKIFDHSPKKKERGTGHYMAYVMDKEIAMELLRDS